MQNFKTFSEAKEPIFLCFWHEKIGVKANANGESQD
jgi:hypothetical protein